jgi:glycine/D-amino acid oxidase-like deaminating enzyme
MKAPSAIVVGAGIVGAACAEALAEAGCHVTVLDSAFAGAGATGAAMGHLVVMDDSEAQFALTAFSRRLWTERAGSLPPELEDDPCGTLWVAADEEEMGHVRRRAAFYEARG